MAVTVDDIRARKEFASTDAALIEQSIIDAEAQVNSVAYGDNGDLAVKYMAMHLVAMAPFGQNLRLDPKKEPDGAMTLYQRLLNGLQKRSVIGGPVVVA